MTNEKPKYLTPRPRRGFALAPVAGLPALAGAVFVDDPVLSALESHYVRDVAFAEDASRIRKNPDIAARLRSFAYNLLRANGCDNMKNARWRAAIDLDTLIKMNGLTEN
jgi:hypothetical protein